MEKSRRQAFRGLQIKYTLAPVLWLYGIVFAVLTGLFLYNWFTGVADATWAVSFLEQLKALPFGLAFFVLVIGVQVILKVGFSKQDKNELAVKRIPLPEETRAWIRLSYSFFVTLSAFLVYFLMLCLLLVLENCLTPEAAYGGAEIYPAFYMFPHLYRLYPVANGMAIPALPVAVAAVSVMAPMAGEHRRNRDWNNLIWIWFILMAFTYFSFGDNLTGRIESFVCMIIFGGYGIGKVVFAYRRRQKDDRTELSERVV